MLQVFKRYFVEWKQSLKIDIQVDARCRCCGLGSMLRLWYSSLNCNWAGRLHDICLCGSGTALVRFCWVVLHIQTSFKKKICRGLQHMFISHINKIFTDTSSYRSTVVFDSGWVRFKSASHGFFENKVVMIALTLDTMDRTEATVVADTCTTENIYFSMFLLLCPCLRYVSHQLTFHC